MMTLGTEEVIIILWDVEITKRNKEQKHKRIQHKIWGDLTTRFS